MIISGKKKSRCFVKGYFVFIVFCFFISADLFGASMSPGKAKDKREKLVESAMEYLGAPYRYGSTGPKSFDCSGFVSFIVKKNLNVKLPRRSGDIYNSCEIVDKDELEVGDLVFFKAGAKTGITHVGIYIGNDKFISALSDGPKTGVQISSMVGRYWKPRFYGVGRLIPSGKIIGDDKAEDKTDN